MTVKGVLLHFLLGYFGTVVLLQLCHLFISPVGISGMITGTSASAFFLLDKVCMSFGRVNHRYFTEHEKTITAIGIISIHLSAQIVLLAVLLLTTNPNIRGNTMAFVSGLSILSSWLLYYTISVCKKKLLKKRLING